MARAFAQPLNIPAYIYDAVTSDELLPEARVTGFKEVTRTSFCHVLNRRATAHKYAEALGRKYEDMNLVVAHLGGGISISAHSRGRIIDSVSDDAGPFSPDRSGATRDLVGPVLLGQVHQKGDAEKAPGRGRHVRPAGHPRLPGDRAAHRERGRVGRLSLQGPGPPDRQGGGHHAGLLHRAHRRRHPHRGLANSKKLTGMVIDYLHNLVKVVVIPGENEMEALALGALRILRGENTRSSVHPACALVP